jgi:hypothetical protein
MAATLDSILAHYYENTLITRTLLLSSGICIPVKIIRIRSDKRKWPIPIPSILILLVAIGQDGKIMKFSPIIIVTEHSKSIERAHQIKPGIQYRRYLLVPQRIRETRNSEDIFAAACLAFKYDDTRLTAVLV